MRPCAPSLSAVPTVVPTPAALGTADPFVYSVGAVCSPHPLQIPTPPADESALRLPFITTPRKPTSEQGLHSRCVSL